MADELITKKITEVQNFANGNLGTIIQVQGDEIGQTSVGTLKQDITNSVVSELTQAGGVSLNLVNMKGTVPTYADLPTSGVEVNDAYQVLSDGLVYVYTDTGFQADGEGFNVQPEPTGVVEEDNPNAVSGGEVFTITNQALKKGFQLFDKETAQIEVGSMSNTTGALSVTNHNFRVRIPNSILKVGNIYTIETPLSSPIASSKASFFNSSNIVVDFIPSTENRNNLTFTVPENTAYTYLQLGYLVDANTYPLRDNPAVNEVMLNEGEESLPFEPYGKLMIRDENIKKYDKVLNLVDKNLLVTTSKKNLLNESLIDFTKRYSPGSKSIVNRGGTSYALAPLIRVIGGEWYAWNCSGGGGYFANETATTAVDNITFVTPVDGIGLTFQVPMEYDGYYVALNVITTSVESNELLDNYQLEKGEQTTTYEPYEIVEKINPIYLDEEKAPVEEGLFEKLTETKGLQKKHHNFFTAFRKNWLLKNKDLVVVNTGTSLTARTAEHCTNHTLEKERPPLMHSNNLASFIWDEIKWSGQKYRRYDYAGFFSETSSFTTTSNVAEWDDGAYRQGWTRISNGLNAGVSFVVPINAFQFNFIFRTDSLGTEAAKISINEGVGQIEVFDESDDTWKEAHNFVFSMREPTPVVRNILVPRASTGEMVSRTIQSKGNTTYQKRLKMRTKSDLIDSRAVEKNVQIQSQDSGRFLYWGVEWSERQYMITYINAARGSHNTQADTANGLPKFQDNEIWSFKPDLLLFELPIHNDGASGANAYTGGYWGRLTDHFVFKEDYELSLKTRGLFFGLTPEIGMHTASISWNFGGINEDGSLKFGEQLDGKMMTALDKYDEAVQWVRENKPEALIINSAQDWVRAGNVLYGDLKTATLGSGKNGATFTNEGSHWNDTGSKIIARTIIPYLNFEM